MPRWAPHATAASLDAAAGLHRAPGRSAETRLVVRMMPLDGDPAMFKKPRRDRRVQIDAFIGPYGAAVRRCRDAADGPPVTVDDLPGEIERRDWDRGPGVPSGARAGWAWRWWWTVGHGWPVPMVGSARSSATVVQHHRRGLYKRLLILACRSFRRRIGSRSGRSRRLIGLLCGPSSPGCSRSRPARTRRASARTPAGGPGRCCRRGGARVKALPARGASPTRGTRRAAAARSARRAGGSASRAGRAGGRDVLADMQGVAAVAVEWGHAGIAVRGRVDRHELRWVRIHGRQAPLPARARQARTRSAAHADWSAGRGGSAGAS